MNINEKKLKDLGFTNIKVDDEQLPPSYWLGCDAEHLAMVNIYDMKRINVRATYKDEEFCAGFIYELGEMTKKRASKLEEGVYKAFEKVIIDGKKGDVLSRALKRS